MNERDRRIGLNEAVFRELNERLDGLTKTFAIGSDELDLVCECGDGRCVERLVVPREEYESVRAEPHRFIVYPGHGEPAVERVLAKRSGYDVIEKRPGEPTALAGDTDPRSAGA